jgi:hypothetical protein
MNQYLKYQSISKYQIYYYPYQKKNNLLQKNIRANIHHEKKMNQYLKYQYIKRSKCV